MASKFPPNARRLWDLVLPYQKTQILNNVWCSHCANVTTIVHYSGKVEDGDLVLKGECERCGGKVARVIENE